MAAMLQMRSNRDAQRAIQLLHRSRMIARAYGNRRSHANHLANLGVAYASTSRPTLARLCFEEAGRVFETIDPPLAQKAREMASTILGSQDDAPEPLDFSDITQIAEAAVQGDEISLIRFRRFSQVINAQRDEVPEFAVVIDRVRQVIDGERDTLGLTRGLDAYTAVQLRLLLINVNHPGLADFLATFVPTLKAIIAGDTRARAVGNRMLSFIADNRRSGKDDLGIQTAVQMALDGQSDPARLVSGITDHMIQETVEMMLTLETPTFSHPDYSQGQAK